MEHRVPFEHEGAEAFESKFGGQPHAPPSRTCLQRFLQPLRPTPEMFQRVCSNAVICAKATGAGLGLGFAGMGGGMLLGGFNSMATLAVHSLQPQYAGMSDADFETVTNRAFEHGAKVGAYPGTLIGLTLGVLLIAGSQQAKKSCAAAAIGLAAGSAAYDVAAIVGGFGGATLAGIASYSLSLGTFDAAFQGGLPVIGLAAAWAAAIGGADAAGLWTPQLLRTLHRECACS